MTPHKLTDDQIRTIRRIASNTKKKYKLKDLGMRYGVSDTVISQIIKHQIYDDVPDEKDSK